MAQFRVGIIGCGRPWKTPGASGFGMSNFHAAGYAASPDTTITALADINLDNARAFQAAHGGEQIYADYQEMLAREQLDIVSICTWPHHHAPMVIAAAEAGVKAIHCEKPMAPSYAEALRMVTVCEAHGTQLTFNHQRRFSHPFQAARDLLRSGAIGQLERLEGTCDNLFDWGTHWFDIFGFYNDESAVDWVIGQVDWRGGATIFGVPVEGQGVSLFRYANGVQGLLLTGLGVERRLTNRLVGSSGMIDVILGAATIRIRGQGDSAWRDVPVAAETAENLGEIVGKGVLDLIDTLKTGREPELSARRALRATELIFATYESSRRGGRVELPLEALASPFPGVAPSAT
ncbi:MAG TPA: Gfo/Idh/MocA family oxidoreductase [Herpetosiphonaceae bacterium]